MNIFRLSTLRGRLTAWYAVALVVVLAVFGAGAVFIIDRELRASLDARLSTTAQAAFNFVDVSDGSVSLDEHDREQILALVGSQTEVAVVRGASNVIFSTSVKPSDRLVVALPQLGYLNVAQTNDVVRALVLPINLDHKRVGSVVAWTTTTWIQESDRRVAAAFALAAALLAAFASIAGSAVTRRALEDAFARQHRFAADASHELRAPLSVIRAEADLALRKPRAISAYQAAIATIASEADRMEALVSALLEAARSQEARREPTVIDLGQLATRVCGRLEPTATTKDVAIAMRPAAQCTVVADREALESAVTAVLHNAIKYTPPGGRINLWIARQRNNAELHVRDGGPGFSAEALLHGVEWFWRDDSARAGAGTGVGLAVADSIARSNRGHVLLGNSAEGGAEVSILLPLR